MTKFVRVGILICSHQIVIPTSEARRNLLLGWTKADSYAFSSLGDCEALGMTRWLGVYSVTGLLARHTPKTLVIPRSAER